MRIIKRLLKWFLCITGGLLLLVMLFLVVPGFECSWRTHAQDPPLLALHRKKIGNMEVRHVRVGWWHASLILFGFPVPPGEPRGAKWEERSFLYMGDSWEFIAGELPSGAWFDGGRGPW